MSDVIKKMSEHVPECFLGLRVFLPAGMTIPSGHGGAAIQTICFLSKRCMTHLLIFLKNKQETLNGISFSL